MSHSLKRFTEVAYRHAAKLPDPPRSVQIQINRHMDKFAAKYEVSPGMYKKVWMNMLQIRTWNYQQRRDFFDIAYEDAVPKPYKEDP